VFDAQFEDLEETLNASIEHFDKEEDARALSQIEAHDVETAEQKSDLIAVQDQMYRNAAQQSEDEQFKKAIEESLGAEGAAQDVIDRDIVGEALQASLDQHELQAALQASLSSEDEVDRALQLSSREACTTFASSDEALQAAIALSIGMPGQVSTVFCVSGPTRSEEFSFQTPWRR